MSTHKNIEPLSDHPLFRALVLMGGALSVGCGGVAERQAPDATSEAASGGSANGASAGANSVGGSDRVVGGATGFPATQTPNGGSASTANTGGSAGTNAGALYNPSCPYEQWDCTAASPTACYFTLKSKDDPLAAGCKCDPSRPRSASACKPDEQFLCLQAYPPYVEAQPGPRTWDGALHVQCACVVVPVPTWQYCNATCAEAFNALNPMQCYVPSDSTCDERGVCTATSADVLRQDGIMCGCADIGLK